MEMVIIGLVAAVIVLAVITCIQSDRLAGALARAAELRQERDTNASDLAFVRRRLRETETDRNDWMERCVRRGLEATVKKGRK